MANGQECAALHCHCLSRHSRFRCFGIRGCMATQHIAGCVAVFATPATRTFMAWQKRRAEWPAVASVKSWPEVPIPDCV